MDWQGRDISSTITVDSSQPVSTSQPTAPGTYIILTYSVVDSEGRQAQAAIRRLTVACQDGQVPCSRQVLSTSSGSSTSSWACLTEVMCTLGDLAGGIGSVAPSALLSTALTTNSTPANSTSGSSQSLPGSVLQADAAALTAPVLELVGPATVYLQLLDEYRKCEKTDPLDMLCDRGAVATDEVDGDLTAVVEACEVSRHSWRWGQCLDVHTYLRPSPSLLPNRAYTQAHSIGAAVVCIPPHAFQSINVRSMQPYKQAHMLCMLACTHHGQGSYPVRPG